MANRSHPFREPKNHQQGTRQSAPNGKGFYEGIKFDEFVQSPDVMRRFREEVVQWRKDYEKVEESVEILPRRAMTLPEKYAAMAAIHDKVYRGPDSRDRAHWDEKSIDPWQPDTVKGDSTEAFGGSMNARKIDLATIKADRGRLIAALQEHGARADFKLIDWIRKRGGSVTVRDLTHGLRRFRKDTVGARAALSKQIDAGLGHWRYDPPGPRGGPPTEWFVLGVTVTTTPTGRVENRGYGDGDAVTVVPSEESPVNAAYADALGDEADSAPE